MKTSPLFLALALSVPWLAASAQAAVIPVSAGADLQTAIDQAQAGDTLRLAAGGYAGKIVINKPLTLEGGDKRDAVIQGDRTGRTITVAAPHVTIKRLTVTKSGISLPNMDAGIFLDKAADAAHIVENAAQYGLRPSETAPWLIANFVLNRFLQEPENSELAWDNVIYGSPHLGYVAAGNQLIRAAKPPRTVFTAYTAPVHDTTQNIRRLLLDADAETLLRPAAADLLHAYGSHFWRSVETVSLTVRGHGMAVPRPGYLTDPALLRLRQTRPPLLFAHSGMSGYSVFEEAAYWGAEAAKKIIEAV